MLKRVTKERVVKYEEDAIICDLCEGTVPENGAMLTLTPQIAGTNGSRSSGDTKIEICSVECLIKNAGAAGLVLNTKIFPELRGKTSETARKRKEQEDMMDVYRKAADFGGYKKISNPYIDQPIWTSAQTGRFTSSSKTTPPEGKSSSTNEDV